MQTITYAESPRIIDIKPLTNPASHLRPSASNPSLLHTIRKSPSLKRRLTFQGFNPEGQSPPERASSATGHRSPTPSHVRWSSIQKIPPPPMVPVTPRAKTSAGIQHDVQGDRESMHALAEFLRSKPPPSSNYMSQPDSDEDARYTHSGFGKLVMRRRGRSKSKSRKRPPPLIQLPDSAVAATTMDGHRHIAISIPQRYELDAQSTEKPLPQLPPSVPASPVSTKSKKLQKGPIVVLKSVQEVKTLAQCMDDIKEEDHAQSKQVAASPASMHISALARSPVKKTIMIKRSRQATPPPEVAEITIDVPERSPKKKPSIVIERDINIEVTHEARVSESTIGSATSRSSDNTRSLGKSSISRATSHGSSSHSIKRPSTAPRMPSSMTLENALRAAAARIHAFDTYREGMEAERETPEMLRRELFDNPSATMATDDPDHAVSPLSPVPLELLLPPTKPEQRDLKLDTQSLQIRAVSPRPLSMALAAAYSTSPDLDKFSLVPSRAEENDAWARTRSSNPVSPATSAVAPSPGWNRDALIECGAKARVMTSMMVVASIPPSSPSRPSTPTFGRSPQPAAPTSRLADRRRHHRYAEDRTHTMTTQSSAAVTIASDLFDKRVPADRSYRTPVDSGFPSSSSPSSPTYQRRPKRMSASAYEVRDVDAPAIGAGKHASSHASLPPLLDDREEDDDDVDIDADVDDGNATDTDMLSVRRRARRSQRNSMIRTQTIEARLKRLEMDNRIMLEALSGIAGGFSVLRNNGLLDARGQVTPAAAGAATAPRLDGPTLARRRIEGWNADVEEKSRWSGAC